jgi:hypothetical protein
MTTELLATFEDVQNIIVVGRRWFERTNGNTYHSAEIYVNGHMVHKIGFTYGYGYQFEWSAWDWLKTNGYIKCEDRSCPSTWCRKNGIEWSATVADVARKRDL